MRIPVESTFLHASISLIYTIKAPTLFKGKLTFQFILSVATGAK